ncbi:prenyltransferase [Neptuniibacter halophilus]|uniref:prenyltransferase n=1 Tax=Neptuniibacter halophilus TaxID=651666 RepID=UPI00257382C4|nr:prenyltransferase [Neptuniibacter halophilus]
MVVGKYQFWRALRPFSFSVALVVCLTGVLAAFQDGFADYVLAALVLSAGLLLQAGVNLINDYSDLDLPGLDACQHKLIRRNFSLGLVCFLLAAGIGLYLISASGLVLLWLSLTGLIGALGYTLEPINYKRRGLAVALVFWLMGVLMVLGSYYALSAQLSWRAFYLSLPVSLFTSLLLLSNELRDYESDRDHGIATLSVRLGFVRAAWLYRSGLVMLVVLVLWLTASDILPTAYWTLLSLPVVVLPLRHLQKAAPERVALTPETGRAFLCFGLCYCSALILG